MTDCIDFTRGIYRAAQVEDWVLYGVAHDPRPYHRPKYLIDAWRFIDKRRRATESEEA